MIGHKIMNKHRQNGFILFLVITVMLAMGGEMYILADMSNTMLLHTNTAYLKACQRNLTASGAAWAKQNLQKISGENVEKIVQLDVNELDIKGSSLKLTNISSIDKEPEVSISTTCSRGRQSLRRSFEYKIDHD
jgi:hypothetical protein